MPTATALLTIHLMDSFGTRTTAQVPYCPNTVPAAHNALMIWQQDHPTLTVLGTHGWPASLLPTIPRDPLRCVA